VADFVKGTFHQHATQPMKSCHRAANDIDACGGDLMHKQDDGGTDADTLLAAISASGRGYDFVGLIGNEEPATDAKKKHNLVTLSVTENQIGAMCTKGDKHCKNPCDPVPPSGSGPWTTIDINNLHREYIQDVPGYFVQHPTTDPQRDQILAQMQVDPNVRGMEVYNSWVEQAWDTVMPRDDVDIDPLHPVYQSSQCLAWGTKSACQLDSSMYYWDTTLRTAKRPIYGLADDDGFVYTGDSDDGDYEHGKKDVQTDTASWFRFGQAWNMVDVPSDFSASDVSNSVDAGNFYASSGVELSYNISDTMIEVVATEPVVYGVAGGVGSAAGSDPLAALNVTLCASASDPLVVTNVGCGSGQGVPPAAPRLHLDLAQVSGSFFYARVQALVRTRYPISAVPSSKSKWEFTLANTPNPSDVLEGRLLRATGDSRRPFLVQSATGNTVRVVSSFSDGWGDITPDSTTVTGIVAGQDQLVAERWAWMQPVFRKATASGLVDPFLSASVIV